MAVQSEKRVARSRSDFRGTAMQPEAPAEADRRGNRSAEVTTENQAARHGEQIGPCRNRSNLGGDSNGSE